MVSPIHSINFAVNGCDSEYMQILMELRRLGIAPSGIKAVDKTKLEQAKAELIAKIKNKEQAEMKASTQVQTIDPVDEVQNSKRSEMEEQRLGAMTVAELNRLYFGI